jgi:hypothetical protein
MKDIVLLAIQDNSCLLRLLGLIFINWLGIIVCVALVVGNMAAFKRRRA